MAELSTPIPGVGPGILHPAFSHKFMVDLGGVEVITRQVTKVKLDMLNSTLEVHIEQPIGFGQEMLDEIRNLIYSSVPYVRSFPFSISLLNGEKVHSKINGFCVALSHEFWLDYAVSAVATHKLLLKYTPAA